MPGFRLFLSLFRLFLQLLELLVIHLGRGSLAPASGSRLEPGQITRDRSGQHEQNQQCQYKGPRIDHRADAMKQDSQSSESRSGPALFHQSRIFLIFLFVLLLIAVTTGLRSPSPRPIVLLVFLIVLVTPGASFRAARRVLLLVVPGSLPRLAPLP